jgi:hypothetical protein
MRAKHRLFETSPAVGKARMCAAVIAASAQQRGLRAAQQQAVGSVKLSVNGLG